MSANFVHDLLDETEEEVGLWSFNYFSDFLIFHVNFIRNFNLLFYVIFYFSSTSSLISVNVILYKTNICLKYM
jgi:hypothetical protein